MGDNYRCSCLLLLLSTPTHFVQWLLHLACCMCVKHTSQLEAELLTNICCPAGWALFVAFCFAALGMVMSIVGIPFALQAIEFAL